MMEKLNKALLLAPLLGLSACGEGEAARREGDREFYQGLGYDSAARSATPYLDCERLTSDIERAHVLGEEERHVALSKLRNAVSSCREN